MPSQILLFDQARSGSHMLVRMLTHKNPDIKLLDHPCGAARGPQMEWLQADDYAGGMEPEVRNDYDKKIETGTKKWQEESEEAEKENKTFFVHEHLFTTIKLEHLHALNELATSKSPPNPTKENFTEIPTSLLLHSSTIPLFTIRHPRQAAPSAFRVLAKMDFPNGGGKNNFLLVTNLIHTRALYDFYTSNGIEPVVVDFESHADPAFLSALAAKLGLEPGRVAAKWEPANKQELRDVVPWWYASQRSLITSGGFLGEKLAVNVDEGVAKWVDEFGATAAHSISQMVELSLPHFEWLFERRFKL